MPTAVEDGVASYGRERAVYLGTSTAVKPPRILLYSLLVRVLLLRTALRDDEAKGPACGRSPRQRAKAQEEREG